MKRIYLFTLLVLTSLSLSVTAGHAQVLDPGCSPQMWGYMEDQADAMRARNKAYEREILNRQPSTLYLTCFDQAMALSARLGYIFSDNIKPNPPPADTVVFDAGSGGIVPPGAGAGGSTNTVAFPDWGARESLALDLNTVVAPEFDNWLDGAGLTGGLYNFLPQWDPANDQMKALAAALNAIMVHIKHFQGTGAGAGAPDATAGTTIPAPTGVTPRKADEEGYIKLVTVIDGLVKNFPAITLTGLPAALDRYNTLTGYLDTLVAAIKSNRNTNMAPLLDELKTDVMGTTIVSMTCTRMDDLWDKLDPSFFNPNPPGTLGAFYPPEGNYYLFSPYYTLGDLLNYGAPPLRREYLLR